MGDVRGSFAVSGRCPFARQTAAGSQECRHPTAIIVDRYGVRYLFAPTFGELNLLIAAATTPPARSAHAAQA
jgi:hypothetical protein